MKTTAVILIVCVLGAAEAKRLKRDSVDQIDVMDAFQRADEDGDGKLSYQELLGNYQKAYMKHFDETHSEFLSHARDYDTDLDSQWSIEELRTMFDATQHLYQADHGMGQQYDFLVGPGAYKIKDRFYDADEDGNKKLSSDELKSFLHPIVNNDEGLVRASKRFVRKHMAEIDTDQDQHFDKLEARRAWETLAEHLHI